MLSGGTSLGSTYSTVKGLGLTHTGCLRKAWLFGGGGVVVGFLFVWFFFFFGFLLGFPCVALPPECKSHPLLGIKDVQHHYHQQGLDLLKAPVESFTTWRIPRPTTESHQHVAIIRKLKSLGMYAKATLGPRGGCLWTAPGLLSPRIKPFRRLSVYFPLPLYEATRPRQI